MDAMVNSVVPFIAVLLLLLALAFPLRLLFCLFSTRARQAARRRWRAHLAWGVLSAGYLGFLAYTALRAPGDYADRARIYEGYNIASAARVGVSERWERTGTLAASNEEAGVAAPQEMRGHYLESVTVRDGGVIVLHYRDTPAVPEGARGRELVLTPEPGPDGLRWRCTSNDMPARLRPAGCRGE